METKTAQPGCMAGCGRLLEKKAVKSADSDEDDAESPILGKKAKAATKYERALARGRCKYSDGASWSNYFSDYVFHVAQTHTLLGCFFCDPLHPFAKSERVAVLIAVSTLAIPPSAVLALIMVDAKAPSQVTMMAILLSVTLPVMVLQKMLQFIAVMDVWTHISSLQLTLRFLSNCFLITVALFACAVGCVCALVLQNNGVDLKYAMWPFAVSRLQDLVLWFPIDYYTPYVGFCWRWRREINMTPVKPS